MRKLIIGAVETLCLLDLTASTYCVLGFRVPKPAQMRKYPLQLVVQTTKKIYRAGEPIRISGYLKNTSEGQSFYVGRELGSFCAIMSFHYIELEIIDEKYKRIPTASSAAAGAWKEGTTQREKLRQEYVLL